MREKFQKSKIETLRRFEVAALTVACVLCSAVAAAQPAGTVYRIGYIAAGKAEPYRTRVDALRHGLRDLGYVEGKNIVIEERYADGKKERWREQAEELVRLKIDVIVTHGNASVVDQAAAATGKAIPIVMAVSADPVETGLVASLSRPGGNITGLSDFHTALIGKRLEIFTEAVPSAKRIGFLWHSESNIGPFQWKNLQAAASVLGVTLLSFDIKGPDGLSHAFAAMREQRPGGLVVQGHPLIAPNTEIITFAIQNRLPTIFTLAPLVEQGGLMSYGANHHTLYHRAATFVDKILKGRKPADLPIEQPLRFDLVVNLKTAKQIGVTIPPSILVRATRLIQ